jgi:arsenate reductase
MKNVLFVCYGNIMRSQMAEGFYNHFTDSDTAASAGTDEFSTGHYTTPHPDVISVMKEEGIDISDKKVKYVTEEMIDAADEVYVLTGRGDCPEFITSSPKVIYWQVPDPYGMTLDSIRRTRDSIKEKVSTIV